MTDRANVEAASGPNVSSGTRQLLPRLPLAVIAALIFALATPITASAHIIFSDGVWSFRYFTKSDSPSVINFCDQASSVDPTTIILWQYGEYTRMYTHLQNETHFGPQSIGSDQYICAAQFSGDNYWGNIMWDQQTGHGNLGTRAHFRMWYAPHGHSNVVDKWSIIEPHHEACCSHSIDEDWETWEDHVSTEMSAHHNWYPDYWYRYPLGAWRGFYQDGYTTRIGGLHDGSY